VKKMNKKLKIAIPVIAGVAAIGSSVGVAYARNVDQIQTVQQPTVNYDTASVLDTQSETPYPYYCGGYGMMGYGAGFGVTQQLADLLNTTPAELRTRLDSGATLADIAAEEGVTQDQLIETVVAPFNDHIDLMVKYGYVSQDDAVTLREQAREQAQTMITSQTSDQEGWWEHMDEMMDEYGHGGMMWGWDAHNQDQGNTAPDTDDTPGYGPGGMMGGGGGTSSSRSGWGGFGDMMDGLRGMMNSFGGMMGGFGGMMH
jgi:hypothetical protein